MKKNQERLSLSITNSCKNQIIYCIYRIKENSNPLVRNRTLNFRSMRKEIVNTSLAIGLLLVTAQFTSCNKKEPIIKEIKLVADKVETIAPELIKEEIICRKPRGFYYWY